MNAATKGKVRVYSLVALLVVSTALWLAGGWLAFQLVKAVVV